MCQIVRIAGFARNGTDAHHRAEGPLGHVGLGQYDGAGGFQGFHHRGVLVGRKAFECDRASRSLQAGRVVVILYNQNRAVQRPQLPSATVFGIELPGGFQRGGVRDDDGVELGGLVVGGNAGLICVHQLLASAVAVLESLLHVGYRGFRHLKGGAGSLLLRRGVATTAGRQESGA